MTLTALIILIFILICIGIVDILLSIYIKIINIEQYHSNNKNSKKKLNE